MRSTTRNSESVRGNRRDFVKTAGAALAGCALSHGLFSGRAAADQVPTPSGVGQNPHFHGPVGLQLYSLRRVLKEKGPLAVLDQTRQWGFKYVEVSALGDLTPVQYKAELDRRQLTPISKAFPYARLQNDINRVLAEAAGVGVRYVGCAYIPYKKPFDEKQCRSVVATFNKAGKAVAKHGMKCYLHNHGQEFVRHGDGTLFDMLVAETDPELVSFEMDVCWVVQPLADPVALLEKYPGRFLLMHLKDHTGGVSANGKVDWPAVLRASPKAGVKWYFLEDESPDALRQIPQSLRYLEQLKM